MASHPGHKFWERDFTGSSGLFAFALKPEKGDATERFIEALKLFGIGSSWGGYESLALPVVPAKQRTASVWSGPEKLVRLHIGQENVEDLISDLERGFTTVEH